MGTTTSRLGLYKPLTDGSELVNVSQDIDAAYDKLDLAVGFQAVTASTRPSSPYSGKPIMQTDTGYSTYFHNGTSPASAGWVEIPNSSSTFANNLRLASGKQLNIGASTSTAPISVVVTATGSNVLSSRIAGDTTSRLIIDGDGALNWGPGGSSSADTKLYRSAVDTLKTDDSLVIGGDIKLVGGTTIYRNKLFGGAVTLANTTTETVLATYTIPAADAVTGATYRIEMWGQASCTGTPTITFRGRIGGSAGTSLGPNAFTFASGVVSKRWRSSLLVTCTTTGASGTWASSITSQSSIPTSGSNTTTDSTVLTDGTNGAVRDTTISSDLVITGAWSAASASNTLTMDGYIAERVS
jgi:hypothetical protein